MITPRLTCKTVAGQKVSQVVGTNTSVFNGCFTDDWQSLNFKDADQAPNHAALDLEPSMLANRLSWFFNFTGASCNIDSACSSGPLGLDLACKSLRSGECDMVDSTLNTTTYMWLRMNRALLLGATFYSTLTLSSLCLTWVFFLPTIYVTRSTIVQTAMDVVRVGES
jgi:hypothetical protein